MAPVFKEYFIRVAVAFRDAATAAAIYIDVDVILAIALELLFHS